MMPRALLSRGQKNLLPKRYPILTIALPDTHHGVTRYPRATDIANDPAFDTWTFSQKVLYALDKEVAARRERRINKLLKASRSPNPDACLEDVVYAPDRNINPEQVS